jgi:hypothetical protein
MLKAGLPVAVRFHPRDAGAPDSRIITPVMRDSTAAPPGRP